MGEEGGGGPSRRRRGEVREALHERAQCRVPRALSEWDQRVERVESNRKQPILAGRNAARSCRPRLEHKTGRTSPTRLGSNPGKPKQPKQTHHELAPAGLPGPGRPNRQNACVRPPLRRCGRGLVRPPKAASQELGKLEGRKGMGEGRLGWGWVRGGRKRKGAHKNTPSGFFFFFLTGRRGGECIVG